MMPLTGAIKHQSTTRLELGDSAESKFDSLLLRHELWSALSNLLAKLCSYFVAISCKCTVT